MQNYLFHRKKLSKSVHSIQGSDFLDILVEMICRHLVVIDLIGPKGVFHLETRVRVLLDIAFCIAVGAIVEIVTHLALVAGLILDPGAAGVADGGVDWDDGHGVAIVGGEVRDERGLVVGAQDDVVVDLELEGHAEALCVRRAHDAVEGGGDVTAGEALHGLAEHEDDLVGLEQGFDGGEVGSVGREHLKAVQRALGQEGEQSSVLMDHALLRASQQLLVVLITEQSKVGVGCVLE